MWIARIIADPFYVWDIGVHIGTSRVHAGYILNFTLIGGAGGPYTYRPIFFFQDENETKKTKNYVKARYTFVKQSQQTNKLDIFKARHKIQHTCALNCIVLPALISWYHLQCFTLQMREAMHEKFYFCFFFSRAWALRIKGLAPLSLTCYTTWFYFILTEL